MTISVFFYFFALCLLASLPSCLDFPFRNRKLSIFVVLTVRALLGD